MKKRLSGLIGRLLLVFCMMSVVWAEPDTEQVTPMDVPLKPDQFVVKYLVTHEYLEPLEDNRFYPDKLITRGEFVALLYRVTGWQTHFASEFPFFRDVAIDHAAFIPIERFRELGVLTGQDQGFFYPNKPVERLDASVMMSRTLGDRKVALTETDFEDIFKTYGIEEKTVTPKIRDDFAEGLFLGFLVPHLHEGKVALDLDAPLTRLEAARMMYRLILFKENTDESPDMKKAWLPANVMFQVTPTAAIFQERLVAGEGIYFAVTETTAVEDLGLTIPRGTRLYGEVVEVAADKMEALVLCEKMTLPSGKHFYMNANITIAFKEQHNHQYFIVPGDVVDVHTF